MLCGLCINFVRPKPANCIFCGISEEADFRIAREDSRYVMFMDKWPGATWHYLVVPKAHIASVRDLGPDDVEMVEDLLAMGKSYFDAEQIPEENRRFGFHIPPFSSIPHLHLHCLAMPFKNKTQKMKYFLSRRDDSSEYSKGWGWFIEVDQVIHTLKRGGRIKVSPC
ncbi:hypothetical protein M408DRAFT_326124 [Serendipita vermifera MAFF 305830]|uniref:HIT domain-containing protein n=1 Tax=Serendipita vermifera MAFF 305830 TaxID=933852 RepID=A0A0C2X5J2_SERVB|nr:hypothetical protein M408DRAFT_326124 [Serendipita vermifera MAFF 305830]